MSAIINGVFLTTVVSVVVYSVAILFLHLSVHLSVRLGHSFIVSTPILLLTNEVLHLKEKKNGCDHDILCDAVVKEGV